MPKKPKNGNIFITPPSIYYSSIYFLVYIVISFICIYEHHILDYKHKILTNNPSQFEIRRINIETFYVGSYQKSYVRNNKYNVPIA